MIHTAGIQLSEQWAAEYHKNLPNYDCAWAPGPRRGQGGRCQVPGCTADLAAEPKRYCLKKRICTLHMAADMLPWPGRNEPQRFCFQCAKVEPLTNFDGMKRSCRNSLQRRKARPAATQAAGTATTSAHSNALHQMQQQQQQFDKAFPAPVPGPMSTAAAAAAFQQQQQQQYGCCSSFAAPSATAWQQQQQQQLQQQQQPSQLSFQQAMEASGALDSSGMPPYVSLDDLPAGMWPISRSVSPVGTVAPLMAASGGLLEHQHQQQQIQWQQQVQQLHQQQEMQAVQMQMHMMQQQTAEALGAHLDATPNVATGSNVGSSPGLDRVSQTASSVSPPGSPVVMAAAARAAAARAAAARAAAARAAAARAAATAAPAAAAATATATAAAATAALQAAGESGNWTFAGAASGCAHPNVAAAGNQPVVLPHSSSMTQLQQQQQQLQVPGLYHLLMDTLEEPVAAAAATAATATAAAGAVSPTSPTSATVTAASSAPALPVAGAPGGLAGKVLGVSAGGAAAAGSQEARVTAAQLQMMEDELTVLYSHLQALRQSFMASGHGMA